MTVQNLFTGVLSISGVREHHNLNCRDWQCSMVEAKKLSLTNGYQLGFHGYSSSHAHV
jgi:hypothetical protein